MSVRDKISISHKLKDMEKKGLTTKNKNYRTLDRQLSQEMIEHPPGDTDHINGLMSMNNNYRMAKIDKKAVENARSTPEEESAMTKKRLDQLIVKKYVRAIVGPDDISDSEDGD